MKLFTLAYRLAVQNVKYGQIRLPLAKRIHRERVIDVEYNRVFMLWDVLPDRNDKQLRKQLYIRSRSTSAVSRAGANIDVYIAGEDAGGRKNADKHENRQIQAIPSNLPQPPKRPETPRPELYDAPNLPKIKTSDPPERKNEHSNLAKIANGATAFEIYRRKLLRAQQNNRA